MPFTYVLECTDKTYYTGSTWDLITRLRQHKDGEGGAYTRRRLPVRLVYYEFYERIAEAWGRERQIHGWTHGKKRVLIRDGPGVRVDDEDHPFQLREE